jgi:hypothetical protein
MDTAARWFGLVTDTAAEAGGSPAAAAAAGYGSGAGTTG